MFFFSVCGSIYLAIPETFRFPLVHPTEDAAQLSNRIIGNGNGQAGMGKFDLDRKKFDLDRFDSPSFTASKGYT